MQHEKLVSEMKDRLIRSGFFEKSCFDPEISQAKRDALMLGAAGLDDRKKKPKITMGCGVTDPHSSTPLKPSALQLADAVRNAPCAAIREIILKTRQGQ